MSRWGMSVLRASDRDAVLRLLERGHGLGGRAGHQPAWVAQRLDATLGELARTRQVGIETLVAELSHDEAALVVLADALRVGQTSFFRDLPQWHALQRWLSDGLRGVQRVRGLSVGCSTGPEAYSLAMLLDEWTRAQVGRSYHVTGLDRSAEALAIARVGVYPMEEVAGVPRVLAARHLESSADAMRVRRALCSAVTFTQRDALQALPPGRYEVILCKNLLIYLSQAAGARLLGTLHRALGPGGLLVVARSEVPRLRALGHPLLELAPGIVALQNES